MHEWFTNLLERKTIFNGVKHQPFDSHTTIDRWVVWADYQHTQGQESSRMSFFDNFHTLVGLEEKHVKGYTLGDDVAVAKPPFDIELQDHTFRQGKKRKLDAIANKVSHFYETLRHSRVLSWGGRCVPITKDTLFECSQWHAAFRELTQSDMTEQKFLNEFGKLVRCTGYGRYVVPKSQLYRTGGVQVFKGLAIDLDEGEEPPHVVRVRTLKVANVPPFPTIYHPNTLWFTGWSRPAGQELEALLEDYNQFTGRTTKLRYFKQALQCEP
jgi:hypothetical protein